jgi:general secretion pathway protein B
MSYILEALKKSQAERQLGSAPTINAIPVGAAPQADNPSRRPLWIVLSAAGVAVALALLAWRVMAPAPKASVAVLAATPPPVAVVAAPPPLAVLPPSSPEEPKRAAPRLPAPVSVPAPVRAAAPTPPPPSEDERLPMLRELPEAIQRAVPPLTFGGYMYSKNPADRLLLIDKSLRHEGEEVAPGLVLEKLLPKAAVMNFNGYRYRVPY